MKTITQAQIRINNAKLKLKEQARKKGLTENFGQSEVRKLQDHPNCDPFGTPEQRTIAGMVQQFESWCMNYEGN